MQSTSQLGRVHRDECQPRQDGPCRSNVWWSPCGAHDDSPSWNLGRAKQGDTIRADGTSPRGRGQEDVKDSDKGVLQSAAKPSTRPSR